MIIVNYLWGSVHVFHNAVMINWNDISLSKNNISQSRNCCIISRLSEFCVGHFMTYHIPVGLINRHFVSYYMMYCAGPRAR